MNNKETKKIKTMYKAEISIRLFTIAGAWRPNELSNYFPIVLYKIYTLIAIFLIYSFEFSLLMYLILHALNNIDEFSEALCWVISTIVVCVKMTNIVFRRSDIINLLGILNKNSFQPRNHDEKKRQEKFDFLSR